MVRITSRLGLAIFLLISELAACSYATVYNWTGASGANAFVANTNWSPSTSAPSAGDTATFGLSGDREITLAYFLPPGPPLFGQTNITVADLNVLLGNVTLSNSIIGSYVFPETITVSDQVYLPNSNGSSSLTLGASGFPVSLSTNGLSVQNGASVSVKYGSSLYEVKPTLVDLNGNLTVDGSGSYADLSNPNGYRIASQGGTGSLTIQNGGVANFDIALNLVVAGDGTSSTGTININGANSALNFTDIGIVQVGSTTLGTGTINIGTNVSGASLTIPPNQYATGIHIYRTGTVTVGSDTTTGKLNISGLTSQIDVDGGVFRVYGGSLFNLQGGAALTIENGGTADFKSFNINGSNVHFISGSLSYAGDLYIGPGGVLGPELGLSFLQHLSLTGTTTVDPYNRGPGDPGSGLFIYGGSLKTGKLIDNYQVYLESGSVSVGDATISSNASLIIDLHGTVRDSTNGYPALEATGAVNLGGGLYVGIYDPLTPAPGESFDILDWGTLTGTFSTVSLPDLPVGLAWDTSQLYITGVIKIVATGIPGDYNGNGVVDADDYVVWRDNLGTTHSLPNDSIGGTIGTAQFNQWRARFGQSTGSGSSLGVNGPASAVPEPSSILLLALASIALWLARFPAATFRYARKTTS